MKAIQKRVAVKVPREVHASEHGLFFGLLKREGLPIPMTEFAFAPPRKWRFDFAFIADPVGLPPVRVAVEVEGAVWTRGRHTRGSGFVKDMEKYNTAATLGWRLLRVTPQQLCTLDTITLIKRALNV